jgi:hypothetical protein
MLQFNLADAANALNYDNTRGLATLATRSWDISVTQIECTSLTKPPTGCTQYFYGSGSYTLTSYNYFSTAGTTHLASQHQRICIRRERGKCIGCFQAAAAEVLISGSDTPGIASVPGGCCGYGGSAGSFGSALESADQFGSGLFNDADNDIGYGFDCLIIPGAFVHVDDAAENGVPIAQSATVIAQTLWLTAPEGVPYSAPPQICGNNGGLGIGPNNMVEAALTTDGGEDAGLPETVVVENLSICTRRAPFVLEFMSDDLEGLGIDELAEAANHEYSELASAAGSANKNFGFSITHSQITCS